MRPGCTCPTLKPTCPVCLAWEAAQPPREGLPIKRYRMAQFRYRRYAARAGPLLWRCCGQTHAVDSIPFVTPCCEQRISQRALLGQETCPGCRHAVVDHVQGKCLGTLACRCTGVAEAKRVRKPRRRA